MDRELLQVVLAGHGGAIDVAGQIISDGSVDLTIAS